MANEQTSVQEVEQKRQFYLYVLYLEHDKFYIGMTGCHNPYKRIDMHGDFLGARWTIKHKPVEVIDIVDLGYMTKEEAENEENDLTLAYMKVYGKQRVRGGRMTNTNLLIFKKRNPNPRYDNLKFALILFGIFLFMGLYVILFIKSS